MISESQGWALEQLNEIAISSDGLFEIFNIIEPNHDGKNLSVTISISCKAYPKKENGIPFKVREKIRIDVPWNFPFQPPTANFSHNNYGSFPHVQWGNHICLFQATELEWQPSQGMFGFIERLDMWLYAGAEGQLDPTGMPLHPPIAYPTSNFKIVPQQNTPQFTSDYWGGYVEVTRENEVVAELGKWVEHGEVIPTGRLASVILLQENMPFEYPTTMLDLLKALNERKVTIDIVRIIIKLGVLRTEKGKRAIFILGSSMRGIEGCKRLQHLTGWIINAEQADKFREVIISATEEDKADTKQFWEWAKTAKVEWCGIMEDRDEIVERRDSKSVANFWKGKNVAILGCGAIGSSIANMLARAGIEKLQLFDKGFVTPGILVRQDFDRTHIGCTKVSALKLYMEQINPKINISSNHFNIISLFEWKNKDRLNEVLQADVIIDATASNTISTAFEYFFRFNSIKHPPIVSMCIGHNADYGLVTLTNDNFAGLSYDLDRRSKIEFANSMSGKNFFEEFWPTAEERRHLFQPEPGCSSPTFRGSFADILALTSQMLNVSADWLSNKSFTTLQRTFAITLSDKSSVALPPRQVQLEWPNYKLLKDQNKGYEVRIEPSGFNSILSWIRRSERVNGERVETGGILFGQIDEFLKVIWVNEVSGPPSDSIASPNCFICGTEGVNEMNDEKSKRTTGTVKFVGMWHTHPHGRPIPSPTDHSAMKTLLGSKKDYLGKSFLMLIFGGTSSIPEVSANLFERKNYG